MFSLEGRRAFISGGAGGLGSATARALLSQGADVVIADLNGERADSVKETLSRDYPDRKVGSVTMDVTDDDSVREGVAHAAESLGGVDIVVPAAGVGRLMDFEKMNFADWRWMVGIHLDGTFLCIRHTLPAMLDRGFGRVICFSSVASLQGVAHQVDYAAAKGGIDGLVRALAREVGSRGVTVNAIAPGYFESGLSEGAPPKRLEALRASVPLGRFGDPSEVGALAVYLASDEAAYMTGEVISPNGSFQYCVHTGD